MTEGKKGQYSNEMGIAPLSVSPPKTLHTMATIECQRLVKEETIYYYLFTQNWWMQAAFGS